MTNRCLPTPSRTRTGTSIPTRRRARRASPVGKNSPRANTLSLSTLLTTAEESAKEDGGTLAVDGNKVAEARFDKTIPFRFSLDESFDVGQDTGSPVIDEYDAKMPFKFSGTLNKVEVKLGDDQLSPQKRGELEQLKKDFALRMQ